MDDVRSRIMGIKPLPSLREAFSEVRREESRKKVMMGSKEQPAPTLDASALAAQSFNSSGGDRQKRDRPWCDYCKKLGHYKEACWKLHGKPADWKPKPRFDRDGRAHVAANSESTSVPDPSPFNKEQMEMLQKLLSQVGSGSTTGIAFIANRGGMKPWIVDTGASDHMTGDAAILQNYKPSNGHSSVHIANGSKSKIVGTGSIKLTKTCILTLFSMFQTWIDLKSRKMIGSVELCSGLYLLPCGQSQTKSLKQVAYSLRGESMNEHHQVWESLLEAVPFSHSESPNPSQSAPTELSTPMPFPNTIQEAFKISEWKKAVQDEIDALEKNGTWTITDLPVGKRPVGCKWIFTIKYKADGSVERFKARLDSSLIDCQSRLVLATTEHKNAFLNDDLEEEVYMEIPPGFEGILKLGYKQGQVDHTLFVKKSHAGKMAILIVYVDDIILSGNDMEELQNLKKYLSEEFEVKDLGNLKYFLGMEVARSRKGIVVSQRKYILNLLKEISMLGCKPIDTPMDSQKKLGIEKESTQVDRGRYQRLVGRLIYLSHTRPNIGFAVSATENRDTEVYSDADWTGNIIDRRSTSGYCSFVWGNLVTWRSKKQSVVARSSAEAEYRALAQGICEGIWIKRVLSELGQTSSSPILMMCDNQAAISIAKNPVHHDRTKHIEIERHFITEKVTSETVKLNYVPTKHQTVDILTKALPRPNFKDLTCKLGLYDIYSPA
ncbi:Retrovirus-related Pol polyprotein from transposon RE1 [Vitis vinifera]|uniref:Retrovirus-related Pol polyprotein from transposon RE1 n=1 Tax=Vitis vinifera TaxID=29760 RepID=A0A438EDS9_VITVI|nr:Retrovirus-related Pol polyprotein from transposon RE1 [Vitis vinifera]